MKSLAFVTTNDGKFRSFSSHFNLEGWKIIQEKIITPEIQSDSTESIAVSSAEFATKILNMPVAKEDVGLYISSLNGFPGPFLNQVESWFKNEDFERLLSNSSETPAYWQYSIALAIPGYQTKVFTTQHHGTMINKIKGKAGYISDKLFIPKGETKTIAELLDENTYQKESTHYLQLVKFLQSSTYN
ncbi:MAG: non-canonical purine NTP pyrophosphatase [Patescibacteria group bacterium]